MLIRPIALYNLHGSNIILLVLCQPSFHIFKWVQASNEPLVCSCSRKILHSFIAIKATSNLTFYQYLPKRFTVQKIYSFMNLLYLSGLSQLGKKVLILILFDAVEYKTLEQTRRLLLLRVLMYKKIHCFETPRLVLHTIDSSHKKPGHKSYPL